MIKNLNRLLKLFSNQDGVAAIELAIAAPVLATMSLGMFDVANAVAKRNSMQQASAEVALLVMAKPPVSGNVNYIKAAAAAATGLDVEDINAEITHFCNDVEQETLDCEDDEDSASYVVVNLNDSYTPVWVNFGVGGPIDMSVTRKTRFF